MNTTTHPPVPIDGDLAVSYVLVPFVLITVFGIAAAADRAPPTSAASGIQLRPVRRAERGRAGDAVEGRGHQGGAGLGLDVPAPSPPADEGCSCLTKMQMDSGHTPLWLGP